MDGLRQYVLSVVATALICGVVPGLLHSGSARELVKLVCGLLLTITVIAPLRGYDIAELDLGDVFSELGSTAVNTGTEMSRSAMADIIKAEAEAYVLDKAAEMDLDVSVEIRLSGGDTPIPEVAVIRGAASPYARERLQDILQTQLGIAKENQQWTG